MKLPPDANTAPAELGELLGRLEDLGTLAEERAAVEAALANIAGGDAREDSERSAN